MMEKVKLTEWQKNAIEDLLQEYRKENIVNQHVLGRWGDAYDSLNKLGLDEIVRALYIGYEVEERFKVGDWVVKKETNKIAKITRIVDGYMVYGYWNNSDMEKWNSKHEICHATPEEIKAEQERRVWAGIGRGVGELRKGDVYVSKDDLTYSYDGLERNKFFYDMYNSGKFKGFYPAESFISFDGDK